MILPILMNLGFAASDNGTPVAADESEWIIRARRRGRR